MKITFIQTGGTIDKDYMATKVNHGYNFEISKPAVKTILDKVKPKFNFEIFTVTKKDSLDLIDADRLKICQKCKSIKNNKIIITHGTDTFVKTAKVLSQIKDKVIILTGAMKPEKFQNSDAMFNVGTAIGAIKFLPNGIYIAMNGIINKWNEYNAIK